MQGQVVVLLVLSVAGTVRSATSDLLVCGAEVRVVPSCVAAARGGPCRVGTGPCSQGCRCSMWEGCDYNIFNSSAVLDGPWPLFCESKPGACQLLQFIVDEMTGREQGTSSCPENGNALKLDMWAPVPLWRPLFQSHHFCNRYVLAPSELHACAGSRTPSDCSKVQRKSC
jgi:hypothetical protein